RGHGHTEEPRTAPDPAGGRGRRGGGVLSPDELLSTTRAVRRRLDLTRPVPDELIEECLSLALQAPSGSNRQGWHFVVVTDPALRQGLAELYSRAFARYEERIAAGPAPDATTARV